MGKDGYILMWRRDRTRTGMSSKWNIENLLALRHWYISEDCCVLYMIDSREFLNDQDDQSYR